MAKRRAAWRRILMGGVLCWAAPGAALGITIDVTYTEDLTPVYDPDGSKLMSIAQAAASIWEGYYPNNSFSISIDFCYEALEPGDDGSETLGVADSVTDQISIQFSPNAGWFIDPTPLDHSEFDFSGTGTSGNNWAGQTLFRDLSSTQKQSWFNNNAPDLFEVGYRGAAVAPEAQNNVDMFSTVIHEMGHILGINYDISDETWGPPPFQLGGASIEIEPDPDDSGHLAARSALMCAGCGAQSLRRLPAAIDILAIAHDEDWPTVDLPRQDFLGGLVWNSLGYSPGVTAWEGGRAPDADNDASIRHGGTVLLAISPNVKNLLVDENSRLHTGNFTLVVDNLTTIGATINPMGGAGTLLIESGGKLVTDEALIAGSLDVDSGGMLEAPVRIYIPANGSLELSGGIVDVGNVFLQNPGSGNPAGGTLIGHGTVDASGILVNDGLIVADSGTLLLVSTSSTAIWDLDGSTGAGFVSAGGGDLTVLGPLLTFNGTMAVTPNNNFTLNEQWTIGANGSVNLLGAANAPATWRGFAGAGHVTMRGLLQVDVLGVIDIAITFEPSADVQVADNNDFLRLLASTTYNGGSFTGNGVIEQIGSVGVDGDTTIDVRVYDWDGSETGPSTTSVDPEVVFTINSHSVELTPNDGHDGTINVNGGIVEVNTKAAIHGGGFAPYPWRLDRLGRLNLKNGGLVSEPPTDGPGAIVRGAPLIVEGSVRAIGEDNRIESDATFLAGASVELADRFSDLSLAGATTFLGGSYTGPGILHQEGHAAVDGDTQTDVATYNWDGLESAPSHTFVAPGVQFTLNVGALETSGSDGHDGVITLRNGSSLNVNTPAAWQVDGVMRLDNATVNGSPLVNFGDISGTGAINADVTNHGTISPGLSPGILRINSDFHQLADGLLDMELAGATTGQFDVLRVMGDALLDGTLLVTLLDGFEPDLGATFTILATNVGSISGSFAAEIMPFFNGRTFDVLYNPMSIVLQVVPGTLEADFDEDGDVDGDDLVKWTAGFGDAGSAGHGQGDADGDHDVDGADFLTWQQQLGSGAPADGVSHAVPEPDAAALALLAALAARALFGRRRR